MAGERPLKMFFDGGCRPNPGAMEVAVVVRGRTFHKAQTGFGTNSDAEWRALLYALDVAREMGADDIMLIGDSALVVNQASGAQRPRSDNLRAHHAAFVAAKAGFSRVRVRHIRRSHNLAGIALDKVRNPV
jgi:ribonuclease HI